MLIFFNLKTTVEFINQKQTNFFQDKNFIFEMIYNDNILLILSFCLFCLGLCGIILNVRNVIVTMLCLELMYVSTMFGWIVHSLTFFDTIEGWIISFFLILIAACESAVGLGLLILLSRFEETIDFFEFSRIRG